MPSIPSRISDDDEPGRLVLRQVDLRDVAGDDHLRVEPEPGEDHLHLLGRGVLRLVEDDEAVVQRVVRDEEVVGDVQRVRRGDLDAHASRPRPAGSMRLDEAHRPAAAVARRRRARLRASRNGSMPAGQADVEDVRVGAVVHRPARRAARARGPRRARVREYATPPSERTRKTTSSRSRREHVVYWIRQVRPRWRTGPPSLSSSPCSTPSRDLGVVVAGSPSGTNFVVERVPASPSSRSVA